MNIRRRPIKRRRKFKQAFKNHLSKRRAGRPPSLDGGTLQGRRDTLVSVLESQWGEIGWELQTAKSLENVRAALKPLVSPSMSYPLEILLRESEQPADAKALRCTRSEISEAASTARSAYVRAQEGRELLDEADRALNVVAEGKRRAISAERAARAMRFAEAEQQYTDLNRRLSVLYEKLKDQEAFFSRHELLFCLQSRRCSIKPLNLANAMAGLPLMGCRQSLKRCSRWKCRIANNLRYQIFKTIWRILKNSNKENSEVLVSSIADSLRTMPHISPVVRNELKQNWYYLRRAINAAFARKPHPGALPYVVTAEYFRKQQSGTAVDRLHATKEQLI